MQYQQQGYCKHVYFHWGKISQKCWQDFMRGNFHSTTPISFIKAYGFLFLPGGNFCEDKSAKNPRLQYITECR